MDIIDCVLSGQSPAVVLDAKLTEADVYSMEEALGILDKWARTSRAVYLLHISPRGDMTWADLNPTGAGHLRKLADAYRTNHDDGTNWPKEKVHAFLSACKGVLATEKLLRKKGYGSNIGDVKAIEDMIASIKSWSSPYEGSIYR